MATFSTMGAALLALYLAVIFQTFGNASNAPNEADPNTPFNSGLRFSDASKNGWKNAVIALAPQVAFFGGGALVLTRTGEPFVAACLAFLGVLVGVRQLLWGLGQAFPRFVQAHQHGVLNAAFAAPFVAAGVIGVLVGVL